MSRLTDLIAQAKRENPQLGAELEHELHRRTQRTFGLVFERHLPEKVELPGRPVRCNDVVQVLPERGSLALPDKRTWRVSDVREENALGRVAQLVELSPKPGIFPELRTGVPVIDLVVVAQQDDVIYPGLVQTNEVVGSDDSEVSFHSVINGENYHALKLLTYTHYHKIDCIYIDPPYNTGAKDWKYNNDYVDGEDAYRHSKWLSFMERRLLIARQLLNPRDSILIVTIDEKEYLRLGMLLEQTFPGARIQMVSSVINRAGVARGSAFSRNDEYIYFVYLGSCRPSPLSLSDEWYVESGRKGRGKARWQELYRRGANGTRLRSPGCFYPIFVSEDGSKFISVGEALTEKEQPADISVPDGQLAIFPPNRPNGMQGCWSMSPVNLRNHICNGYVRIGGKSRNGFALSYLAKGETLKVEDSTYPVLGTNSDGSLILGAQDDVKGIPPTQWRVESHDAPSQGSQLVGKMLPGRSFPYPKSLYAVEDTLRFFVKDKPDATVLDFFSGSGTTAHAVMRLNKQDGGRRRSISITNNEVGVDEQKKLRAQGLRPGDADWEKWGICDYVTKPRIEAAITGRTPDGEPIKGAYKFTDEFPMADGFEAKARFFTLTYQPPTRVRHGYAFKEIAPMLWMRAGQVGRIIYEIPDRGWDVAEAYGVIENVAASKDFLAAVTAQRGVRVVYITTNDDLVFESMARELAETDAELVRLYSTYLNNFAFQQARENS